MAGTLGMVSGAGAAEIPPTSECSKLNKQLTREYFESLNGNSSVKQTKRADRVFAEKLAEADCISDAAPLIKEVKAKPRTEQCVAAAKSAGAFWKPYSGQLVKLDREERRALRPTMRRLNRLSKRIKRLKTRGASRQRIRALTRVRKSVVRKKNLRLKAYTKRMRKIIGPQAHDTSLIVTELMSLRCVNIESLFESIFSEKPSRDPVARVIEQNLGLVFISSIYLLVKYSNDDSSGASLSSAASGLKHLRSDALQLPVIPAP